MQNTYEAAIYIMIHRVFLAKEIAFKLICNVNKCKNVTMTNAACEKGMNSTNVKNAKTGEIILW